MSVSLLQPCSALPSSPIPRKRTSSFSFPCAAFANANPRPAKAPRTSMGALRRTDSCASLSEASTSLQPAPATTAPKNDASTIPYHRTLQYQKDQRSQRRKQAASRAASDTFTAIATPSHRGSAERKPTSCLPSSQGAPPQQPLPKPPSPSRSSRPRAPVSSSQSKRSALKAPAQVILPSANSKHAVTIVTTQRTSSPLSPVRTLLPGRPVFPRSKTEPDLYKKALISRMKQTEEGKRIVCMGPRLAISIWMATKELEKIVEDHQQRLDNDMDVDDLSPFLNEHSAPLAPPVLTNSWVVVRPNEDWEMVDCAA